MLLRGEAGIGKSRLVEVLRERVISKGAPRIVLRCSPYHQNSALYPVIDHLQRFLQWQRDETPEAKFDKLEQVLQTYRLPLEDVVPLFAALLSVSLPERYPPLNLNRLGHAQVAAMIASLTDDKPLPTEIVEQIIAKTDGVPLFVEELVKMILESGLVREQADGYVLTGPLPLWPFPRLCTTRSWPDWTGSQRPEN